MGVPGLWDLLRPAGKTRSLVHLAVVDGYEQNKSGKRGYRVGIDASIWFFHAQWGREGENPELRTLFFRLCRLAEMPFLPLFVFDGPYRPSFKRGKRVDAKHQHWLESGVRRMVEAFGWEWRLAPGEAEAELAYLNRIGAIDAVLSDDVDTFLFGARVVVRNPSNTLTGNRSNPTKNADGRDDGKHAVIYRADDIEADEDIGLDRNGMILIGLMSGGDYHQAGLARCGKQIAHGLARCGFGDSLVNAFLTLPEHALPRFLDEWRADVAHELRTNSQGYVGRKYPSLAASIPESFPDLEVLKSYVTPVTTESRGKTVDTSAWWTREMDLAEVAACCELFFEWGVKDIILKRFRTVLWPGACLRILRRAAREQDQRMGSTSGGREDVTATPKKPKRPPKHLAVGTPSKLITRYFSKLGLESPEKARGGRTLVDEDEDPLMVKIHSSRQHASTDGILEYRVEIAPAQLAALAESGIKGTRRMEDLQAGDTFSDLEGADDEEEEGGKKKRVPKPPPDPATKLRVWLPACMLEYVQPGLVEEWEAKEEAKRAKKAGKGKGKSKGKAKAVLDGSEVDEDVPRKKVTVKKVTPKKKIKARTTWASTDEEEDEDEAQPPAPPVRSRSPSIARPLAPRVMAKGKGKSSAIAQARAALWTDEEEPVVFSGKGKQVSSPPEEIARPKSKAPIQAQKDSPRKFLFTAPPPNDSGDELSRSVSPIPRYSPPVLLEGGPVAGPSKAVVPVTKPSQKAAPVKPKAVAKKPTVALSAAAKFFDSLSDTDEDLFLPRRLVGSEGSRGTTAKNSRSSSALSAGSSSDKNGGPRKSPRKRPDQTSPRKAREGGAMRAGSPSPIGKKEVEYIEISDSEEGGSRDRGRSKTPQTLSAFGFKVVTGKRGGESKGIIDLT
ncbi:hypothetical protein FRB99_002980 [Tulasnella sp. 403]|nr:hypothetical protein FRB99_002980 [Tulasnella sp. 403]